MTSGKYFNRGVMSLDHPHIGFVVRETEDKIIVFGEGNQRYDIPLSEIQTVGRNVLIGLNFYEIEKKFKVKMDSPLPTGKYIDPWRSNKTIDLATYGVNLIKVYSIKELGLLMNIMLDIL